MTSISVQSLDLRPKFKVKTIKDLTNNKNSNTIAYKLQIFKQKFNFVS